MSEHATTSQHPVLAALACIEAALKDVADVQPTFMTAREKTAALLASVAVKASLAELQQRVLAVSGDVDAAEGMRNPGAWLAHRAWLTRSDGARRWRLAQRLDGPCPRVARGMREGEVTSGQAHVIVDALDRLPDDLSAETRQRAEQYLVEQARDFEPRRLDTLGRKVLEVVAPDVAEEHERRLVEEQERRAAKRTFLRFRRNGDGTTDLHARLADQVANRLRTYLEAFTNPRRHTEDTSDTEDTSNTGNTDEPGEPAGAADEATEPDPGESESEDIQDEVSEWLVEVGDPVPDEPAPQPPEQPHPTEPTESSDLRPYSERLGAAFGSLLEHLDPRRLPLHGGDATTVIVTIDHQVLTDQLTGVGLIGEEPVSPGELRRLACHATILPVVLGGKSEVLDLGRARRLASAAQRKARAVIDRTCRGEGCDVPAAWCECHHLRPWSQGGRTDLKDLRLLCSHHHHLAHDDRYDMLAQPDGRYRFRRRR